MITREQVRQIAAATGTQRMAVYFWTVYALGLRMQAGRNLKIGGIDVEQGMAHVHRGKGAQDRYVLLPTSLLQLLRHYWATHRHLQPPFPADDRASRMIAKQGKSTAQTVMGPTAVQAAIKKIAQQIHFGKTVSLHTLRFAAPHLLEAGVSLKAIHGYMGAGYRGHWPNSQNAQLCRHNRRCDTKRLLELSGSTKVIATYAHVCF